MPELKFYLLGPPAVELVGLAIRFDRRKTMALLVYLAMVGAGVRRETLAALFWPESAPALARANLRREIFALRKHLCEESFGCDRDTILLSEHFSVWLDVHHFQTQAELVLKADPASAGGVQDTLALLKSTADLYRSDFFAGFSLADCPVFDDWQRYHAESVRQLYTQVLERLVGLLSGAGNIADAILYTLRWLFVDPLDEMAYQAVMRLYQSCGQVNAAIAQYQRCRQVFRDELGVEPSASTEALYQELLRLRTDRSSGRQSGRVGPALIVGQARTSLPTAPFFGRQEEIGKIKELLQHKDSRMIFLCGPGGVGKSALALQVIHDPVIKDLFPGGIVPLAIQSSASLDELMIAVANHLNIPIFNDLPVKKQLVDFLQEKRTLFFIDDVEQRQPGIELFSDLVEEVRGIKILVTSREVLHFREAYLFLVKGLDYPLTDQPSGGTKAFSAVQLFNHIARRVQPEFSAERNRDVVVQICRLVDGIPLAIELAAAWVSTLPTEQVVREIERGLDIFSSSWFDIPERHRSIRAVFERSWKLLSEKEQDFLFQAVFFKDGFTLDAAADVTGASIQVLSSLVQKSLLQVDRSGRYSLQNLLCKYAEEKIGEVGEASRQKLVAAVGARHGAYYLAEVAERCKGHQAGLSLAEVVTLEREKENILAAVDWAFTAGMTDLLLERANALFNFYCLLNMFGRGEEVLSRVVDRSGKELEGSRDAQVPLLSRLGAFYFIAGKHKKAAETLRMALARLRAAENLPELAFCLRYLGDIERWQGRNQDAVDRYRECLNIYQRLDDLQGTAWALLELGGTEEHFGFHETAIDYYRRALAINRSVGHVEKVALCLDKVAVVSFYQGKYVEAEAYWQESYAILTKLGNKFGQFLALGGLGLNSWAKGGPALPEAKALLNESLQLCRDVGNPLHVVDRLGLLCLVENELGEFERSREHCLEGLSICQSYDNYTFYPIVQAMLAEAEAGLGEMSVAIKHFYDALFMAVSQQKYSTVAAILYYLSVALLRDNKARFWGAEMYWRRRRHIATLLQFVERFPATWQIHRSRSAQLMAELVKENLSADPDNGQVLDLDGILKIAEGLC